MAKMTLAQIKNKIYGVDTISVRGGVYTVRRGFFYTSGKTSNEIALRVARALPEATILGHGEVWKDFRGGAPVAQQSHWWVKFTL